MLREKKKKGKKYQRLPHYCGRRQPAAMSSGGKENMKKKTTPSQALLRLY
jgi:hypothetical protein